MWTKAIFLVALISLAIDLFGQLKTNIEMIDGKWVLAKGTFALITKKSEVIAIKELMYADDEFSTLDQFGKPIDVIERNSFVERTKEFKYFNFSIRYTELEHWTLEQIIINAEFGLVNSDFEGNRLSTDAFEIGKPMIEAFNKLSNGGAKDLGKNQVKLYQYAYMSDHNGNIIRQKNIYGDHFIDRSSWVEFHLNEQGSVVKMTYNFNHHC